MDVEIFISSSVFYNVHRLAKYVVGPQGLGQEKIAGLAKNSKDMPIADVPVASVPLV